VLNKTRSKIFRWFAQEDLYHLQRSTIELNDVGELLKLFHWELEPILDDPSIYVYRHAEDVNQRRIRDAESLGAVVRNTYPGICLDIGTAEGHSAALMSFNAPNTQIYTINIPPEEMNQRDAGKLTTITLERERIGSYYRSRNLGNITQILENTAHWQPDIGKIDVAYVDGCHDTQFIINDTKKILANCKTGSYILWHDFNLDLIHKYEWIYSVCLGVEKLFANKYIKGNIFHVRDSWVGIYKIP
jgi:hypothetical protein